MSDALCFNVMTVNNHEASETAGLRQRKGSSADTIKINRSSAQKEKQYPEISKKYERQRRMMRQMQVQRQREREEADNLNEYHNLTLRTNLRTFFTVVPFVLMVGIYVLYTISPSHVTAWFRRFEKLPDRRFLVLYPSDAEVKRLLPRKVRNFAVETPENKDARRLLQQFHALRTVASFAGKFHKRHDVSLNAWEVKGDFEWQLPKQKDMDRTCGKGFGKAYSTYGAIPHLQERAQHDLIVMCLMTLGTHDGYIRWNTTINSSISRGTRGVFGSYYREQNDDGSFEGQGRASSDLLALPILSLEEIAERQKDPKKSDSNPSTEAQIFALHWLVDHSKKVSSETSLAEYTREFESALYEVINYEIEEDMRAGRLERWLLLDVICSQALQESWREKKYRRVATVCAENGGCCFWFDRNIKLDPRDLNRESNGDDDDDDDDK